MRKGSTVAGIGGIAFGLLFFLAFLFAGPIGGTYKAADVADYLARGHRVAVIVSAYLMLLGLFGLICLLARLRDLSGAGIGGFASGRIFWGTGLAAASSFAVGWLVTISPPLARLYGGKSLSIDPPLAYTIAETGGVILFGAGGVLLALALITFVLGSGAALPAWLRWFTLVVGVIGLASPAFFPFFLLLIWGLVTGIWLLTSDSREPRERTAAA